MKPRQPSDDRMRDAATLLPFAAATLLMPPLLNVFAAPIALAGIPLIIVYLFVVWAAIVVSALFLACRLSHHPLDRGADAARKTTGP